MEVVNTLAYYGMATITAVIFIVLVPGVDPVKLFGLDLLTLLCVLDCFVIVHNFSYFFETV